MSTTTTTTTAAETTTHQLQDAISSLRASLVAVAARVPKTSDEVSAWLREVKEVATSSESVFSRLTAAVKSVGDSATLAALRTPVLAWAEWTKAQAAALEARIAEVAARRGDEAVLAARNALAALKTYAEHAGAATAAHVPTSVVHRVRHSTATLRADAESLVTWAREKAPTELLSNASTALSSASGAVKARIANPSKLREDAHVAAQWAGSAAEHAAARTVPVIDAARGRGLDAVNGATATLARAYVWVFALVVAVVSAVLAWGARGLAQVHALLGAKRSAAITDAAERVRARAAVVAQPLGERVSPLAKRAVAAHHAIVAAGVAHPSA